MKKRLLAEVFAICLFQSVFAQSIFHVKIRLDTGINPRKVVLSYYDGKNDIFLPDTFRNHIIVLTGKYYLQYVPLNIAYPLPSTTFISFFISDRSAMINLRLSPDKQLKCTMHRNAKPIWDTTNTVERQVTSQTKKIGKSISALFKKYGYNKVYNDDSINYQFRQLLKMHDEAAMEVLRKYPDNFFSFWYFKDQILEADLIYFKKDTSYLKSLLSYFKHTFSTPTIRKTGYDESRYYPRMNTISPQGYANSVAGRALISEVKNKLNPPLREEIAPEFLSMDISGDEFNLRKYRGKYVLIDFWATWCPPCRREIPFIKKIRDEVPENKLAIVGISWDTNLDSLREITEREHMNWPQIYDRDENISHLYGIPFIPYIFLINDKGVILYKGIGQNDDRQKILNLLKGI